MSKTVGTDFIDVATKVMLDLPLEEESLPHLQSSPRPTTFVGVKTPMFSFRRLGGADPVLGVEMASTGEVACFGATRHEAFLKSLLATGFELPTKGILLSVQHAFLPEVVPAAHKLTAMGYKLYATPKTHEKLTDCKVESTLVPYSTSVDDPLLSAIRTRDIDLVVNVPNRDSTKQQENYLIRRTAVDFNVPLLTNPKLFVALADALEEAHATDMVGLRPGSLFDYYRKEAPSSAWTDPSEFH